MAANGSYKVLVLGAGASLAYGYPLGSTLRERILKISASHAKTAGIIRQSSETQDTRKLSEFQTAFLHSQMYSIDAFLGRRPAFASIGKKCIATSLLECENQKLLFAESRDKDHWYQYLWNYFAKSDWDELTFDEIAIVNFNYDRSLEHFLYVTLQSTYGKSAAEVATKMNSLRIVHVYGSLGTDLPNSDDYLPYDGKVDRWKVERAARELNVIQEGRVDSQTLTTAREWLKGSAAIAFLGFGFDPTNIERLAEDGACNVSVQRDGGAHHVRTICGTRIGMHDAEIRKAFGVLCPQSHHASEAQRFVELDCTQLLRSTLFLG